MPNHIYRVSALWLTNPAGEILLAQRHPHMSNSGGLWGPAAAGTVEIGETYLDNITKEAAEEIGVTGIKFREGPKVFIESEGNGRTYFCQWYFATIDRPANRFQLEADEVSAVRWMSPADLRTDIQARPEIYLPLANRWIGRFI